MRRVSRGQRPFFFLPKLNIANNQKTSGQRRPNCPKEVLLNTYTTTPKDTTIIKMHLNSNYCNNLLQLRYTNPKEFKDMHADLPRATTQRGIRSKDAVEKRNRQRTLKRLYARRQHRKTSEASAQEPHERKPPNLKYEETLRTCALHVQGMNKLAAREDIETFATEEKIDILLASETKINKNQKRNKISIYLVL